MKTLEGYKTRRTSAGFLVVELDLDAPKGKKDEAPKGQSEF